METIIHCFLWCKREIAGKFNWRNYQPSFNTTYTGQNVE